MKRLWLFTFLFVMLQNIGLAYDTFHPEADATLNEGKTWVSLEFEEKSNLVKNTFRSWIPHEPKLVWEVLTDTNGWRIHHNKDYKDSGTLDRSQFELVKEKQPLMTKAFYELIGPQRFPSNHNRKPNSVWKDYLFQVFDLPWPLKNRWTVLELKNDETNAHKGEFTYRYKMAAGSFKEIHGYWKLLPVPGKPGWTEFRGEYSTDPGIKFPKFLAKSIYPKSLRNSIKKNTQLMDVKTGRTTSK